MKHHAMLIMGVASLLSAAIPDYVRVQSNRAVPVSESKLPWSPAPGQSQASARETEAGFRIGVEPLGRNPRPDMDWSGASGQDAVRLFLAPGEFRSVWVVVQGLRGLSGVSVAVTDVSGASGKVSAENFLIRRNVWCLSRREWSDAHCFLASDGPWSVKAGETLWVMVTLHAPHGTRGGRYGGQVQVRAGGGVLTLPVKLSVLNRSLPREALPFGAFMAGHYHQVSRGQYVNYAPVWQRPGRLKAWMELWHSRGLTSPFLYHLYPDVSLKDGAVTVRCPFVAELREAMTAVGMPGPLLLDMRHLSWWSHAVALDLAKRGVRELGKASSSLSGADGLSLAASGRSAFHPLSRDVFRLAFRAFDRAYGHGSVPVIYLAEEEIAYDGINGFRNPKTAGYEMFNPVLLEEAGRNRVCLVDNSQGWHSDRIDRGARDNLRYRSYNNWSQAAVDDCRRQEAQVWYYNGGWSRTIAPYMMRIGAQAFHQWADSWGNRWLVTAMNPDGGVVTLQLERAAEGMRDLAYFRLLDRYGGMAAKAGRDDLAKELQALRQTWFDVLPVKAHEFQKGPAQAWTDEMLDQRRWRTILAVSRVQTAVGERPFCQNVTAQPRRAAVTGRATPLRQSRDSREFLVYEAWDSAGKLKLDGLRNESLWRRASYAKPFRWNRMTERAMRAKAASQEEFERMDPPSGSSACVTYGEEGLMLWAGGNHMSPEHNSSHGDDDDHLWADDVFEFFWQGDQEAAEWHLIVNARGRRTLYRNGTIVRASGVRCAAHAPLNASGGTALECMIPWAVMDLKGKPVPGSVWRFNVCRNFNSWGQLSSWAQVDDQFGLGAGTLLFKGQGVAGNVQVSVCPRTLGKGRNVLTVTVPLKGEVEIELTSPDGRVFLRQKRMVKEGKTVLEAVLPPRVKGGGWWLAVRQDGHVGRVPLWHDGRSLDLHQVPGTVVAGYPLRFRLFGGLGNGEPTQVDILLAQGRECLRLPLPIGYGEHEVWLSSIGLRPGIWELRVGEERRKLRVVRGPF